MLHPSRWKKICEIPNVIIIICQWTRPFTWWPLLVMNRPFCTSTDPSSSQLRWVSEAGILARPWQHRAPPPSYRNRRCYNFPISSSPSPCNKYRTVVSSAPARPRGIPSTPHQMSTRICSVVVAACKPSRFVLLTKSPHPILLSLVSIH